MDDTWHWIDSLQLHPVEQIWDNGLMTGCTICYTMSFRSTNWRKCQKARIQGHMRKIISKWTDGA